MKTCQSTGYFQQVPVILLLCLVSSVVFAGSALALTGNNINACFDCHGSLNDIRPLDTSPTGSLPSYRNITSGAVKGSHRTHVTNLPATLLATTCNPCHGATVAAFDHRDGKIQVNPAVAYTKTPFFNQTSVPVLGTCATASCHANPYGTGNVISPTWGTVSGCASCHNSTSGAAAAFDPTYGAPTTGAHNLHLADAVSCGTCHINVAKNTNTSGVHINGSINVTGYAAPVAKHAIGSGYGSCTTTTCHGTSSPTWGTSTTQAICTKCHGVNNTTPAQYTANTKNAAPGYVSTAPVGTGRDTGGATIASDLEVGAHAVHLSGSSNYSNPIACTECHANVNTTSTAFTGHMDGAGTLVFGALAKSNSTVPSYTAPNCATTYCHFGNPTGSYTPAVAVSWTNTTLLTGTPSLAGDCSKCHLSPPSTTGSHSGITNINQCNGCHDNVTTTGSFIDKSKHVDGLVQGGCDICHGWPPTNNAHTVHINNIIAEKALGSLPGGFVGNQVCGTCHNVSALTKHAGSVGNDGTSRNIYLPSPSALQTSYQYGASPVSYDKAVTTTCSNISCHLGSSTAWGTPPTTGCQSCHGYPPVTTLADPDNKHSGTAVNHIGIGPTVNTKATFVSVHGGCQICHGTQSTVANGSGSHQPFITYTVATQHFTGKINMNGPIGTGTGYDSTIRGCTAACHGSAAPYRMTASGKTLYLDNYGSGGDCISCHTLPQGTRSAVVGEFGLAWGHKKSGRGAVTVADCIVCHLEGTYATQSTSSKHKDGYIDLRDPDGVGEVAITNISGTAFTFTKFATSYGAGSRTATGHLSNTDIANVISLKFCIKCHDANGATNTTARSGTAPTQYLSFGTGSQNGAAYTVGLSAGVVGGVVDVDSSFAVTNSTFHPVKGPQNNRYASGTKMAAPYGVTKTGNTAGVVMNCFDCHNAPTPLTTRTVIAHGSTAPNAYRGTVYETTNTLCKVCHTGYTGTTGNHGTGSAFNSSVDSGMGTYTANRCQYCHASTNTAVRPVRGEDAHGFNRFAGTGTDAMWPRGATETYRPFAFIRSTTQWVSTSWKPLSGPGVPAGTATCGGNMSSSGCGDSMTSYTPGGAY